ncbi:MAG TPA: hypothetical protein VL485_13455 [Ktedonobacteraceae bacterium]|nr:hypothetical protein [Ktedonobacteraceae bacterium]
MERVYLMGSGFSRNMCPSAQVRVCWPDLLNVVGHLPVIAWALGGLGWPVRGFDSELPGVLRIEPRPTELHRIASNDAAEGSSAEQVIQNIETNVPSGSPHGDEAAIDVVPQCQARAASKGFEFPADIVATPVVLKHPGSVGARHACFGNLRRRRSHRGELHRGSSRSQASIGFKGSPLAQMRRVGKRQPDFFRCVVQFSDENERPLLSVLSYLRPTGRTRCVLFAIGHHLLLCVYVD